MTEQERKALDDLINDVEQTLKSSFPEVQKDIKRWTKKEIGFWQDDLQKKTGGRLSERWFYDHIKKDNRSNLPRIDALDLLCQYVGKENFDSYLSQQNAGENKSLKKVVLIGAIILVGAIIFGFFSKSEKNFELIFYQKNSMTPIEIGKHGIVEILSPENEPMILGVDSNVISFSHSASKVLVVAKFPNYRVDTIEISNEFKDHRIFLEPDDYSSILQMLSNRDLEDWEKRKVQMQKMIHMDAMIFQVSPISGMAIDLLTREDFINQIMLPTSSSRSIEILHTEYENKKIVRMKFQRKEK
ncbi:MAG: hypothetical protein MRY83_13360 [Flavobacteriales bacterium]|nr:hypothetical protein [Flavobacteriales bacterium]